MKIKLFSVKTVKTSQGEVSVYFACTTPNELIMNGNGMKAYFTDKNQQVNKTPKPSYISGVLLYPIAFKCASFGPINCSLRDILSVGESELLNYAKRSMYLSMLSLDACNFSFFFKCGLLLPGRILNELIQSIFYCLSCSEFPSIESKVFVSQFSVLMCVS